MLYHWNLHFEMEGFVEILLMINLQEVSYEHLIPHYP